MATTAGWMNNCDLFIQWNITQNEAEQITITRINIDESHKHNLEQKKPDTKDVLSNPIYINFKNI